MLSRKVIKSQYTDLPIPPASSFEGRTYIVTGANTGLGYECSKHLVRLTASRVILAVRSQTRGDEALAKIEAETGRKGVAEVWLLDLASYDSVKAFTKKASSELDRIDGVIENASVALTEWTFAEGIETTITVNVLSTFLLALLLLPKLKATAKTYGIAPYLAVVSSSMAFMGTEGALEKRALAGGVIQDMNVRRGKMTVQRYAESKLLQMYATRELASLVSSSDNVVINYLSPGLCSTTLDRHSTLTARTLLGVAKFLMGRTAEMGSRTLLGAVCAGKESHGKFMGNDCKIAEEEIPAWMSSSEGKEMQKRIWQEIVVCLEKVEPGCVGKAQGS